MTFWIFCNGHADSLGIKKQLAQKWSIPVVKGFKWHFYYQPYRRLAFLIRAEVTKNGRLVNFEISQGVSSSLANFDLNSEELRGNPTFCSLQNLAKSLNSSVSNNDEILSTIKGLVNQLAGKYLAKNYQYGQIFQKVLDERQSDPRKAIYYVPDKHTVRDRFGQNCDVWVFKA